MKTFNIGEKQYDIKTDLDEIALGEFAQITEILLKDYELYIDKYVDIVSVLSKIDRELIEEMNLDDFHEIVSKVQKVNLEQNLIVKEFDDSITINDIEYKAKLKADGTFSPTVKEVFLIEDAIKKHKINYFIYFAAIIFLEDGGKLDIESIKDRAQIFKENMTVSFIMPYITIFSEYVRSRK